MEQRRGGKVADTTDKFTRTLNERRLSGNLKHFDN